MGQNLISNDDVVIAANEPIAAGGAVDDSSGDIVLRTGGVERARIDKSGVGTGLLSGSLAAVGQNIKAVSSASPTVSRFLAPAPVRRLHSLFAPLVCDLAVGLRPNGTDYELLYGLGSARYWRTVLALESTNPGNYPLHQIQTAAEVEPMVSVLGSDASVTRGVGVTGPNANAGAYGGQYWYGVSSGQTFTIVTPSATRVGIRFPSFSNGGLAIVSIGGDKTAANLLPTAQNVVDSGAYPNTILVANAGPCNPTDRVLDTYAGTSNLDNQVAIADGLTAGAQTVVLTPVGVARSVGAGTRVYFSGYGYATAATVPTTAGAVTYSSAGLMSPPQASAWEYALKTGGTFFGNVHGYDVEDSISVTADGSAQTLTAGQPVSAVDVVEITRTSHLVDPANTAATIANVTTVYHLDRDGLRVDNTIVWAAAKTIQAAYVMAALNGVAWGSTGRMSLADTKFSSGRLLSYPLDLTFTGSGDTYSPSAGAKAEAAWVYGGNYGLLMWLPNVSQWVNGWANSGDFVRVEDRGTSGLFVTKIYVGRIWDGLGTEAVSPGTTWQSSTLYLMGRFPSGAAASLGV